MRNQLKNPFQRGSTIVLSELEKQVLSEKAKGLSDLEVAAKLLLYERAVRSIVHNSMARHNDKGHRKVQTTQSLVAPEFPDSGNVRG
jgi:DNA-binding NarL/FixJ family response regulator